MRLFAWLIPAFFCVCLPLSCGDSDNSTGGSGAHSGSSGSSSGGKSGSSGQGGTQSGSSSGGKATGGNATGGSSEAGAPTGGAGGDGDQGGTGTAGGGGRGDGGAGGNGGEGGASACSADGVDRIYFIDDTRRLVSFDPRLIGSGSGPYDVVGTLRCTDSSPSLMTGGGAATPYALSVDRNGTAWVLYTSGRLHRASTADASCTGTAFVPEQVTGTQTWSLFHLGFSANSAGADAERLWVGGGSVDLATGSLGFVDASLNVNRVAALQPVGEASPDIVGLGDATLWGFFANAASDAFIQELSKTNGAGTGTPRTFSLVASTRVLVAWGFAEFGGVFYVFATTTDSVGGDSNTAVHTVNRMTGAHQTLLVNQPYVVIAAGVSTCAPTTEI